MERRIRGGNISVVVRARPLSHYEETRGLSECIEVDADGKRLVVLDPDDKMGGLDYLRLDRSRSTTYAFDRALGPEVTQSQTFDASSSGFVDALTLTLTLTLSLILALTLTLSLILALTWASERARRVTDLVRGRVKG